MSCFGALLRTVCSYMPCICKAIDWTGLSACWLEGPAHSWTILLKILRGEQDSIGSTPMSVYLLLCQSVLRNYFISNIRNFFTTLVCLSLALVQYLIYITYLTYSIILSYTYLVNCAFSPQDCKNEYLGLKAVKLIICFFYQSRLSSVISWITAIRILSLTVERLLSQGTLINSCEIEAGCPAQNKFARQRRGNGNRLNAYRSHSQSRRSF